MATKGHYIANTWIKNITKCTCWLDFSIFFSLCTPPRGVCWTVFMVMGVLDFHLDCIDTLPPPPLSPPFSQFPCVEVMQVWVLLWSVSLICGMTQSYNGYGRFDWTRFCLALYFPLIQLDSYFEGGGCWRFKTNHANLGSDQSSHCQSGSFAWPLYHSYKIIFFHFTTILFPNILMPSHQPMILLYHVFMLNPQYILNILYVALK